MVHEVQVKPIGPNGLPVEVALCGLKRPKQDRARGGVCPQCLKVKSRKGR